MLNCVLTTIQPPTAAVRALMSRLSEGRHRLLVVGDRKGPTEYPLIGADFVPLERQRQLDFSLANELPENHYGRKNLGYLLAIQSGAECVYETDDDNAPLPCWHARRKSVEVVRAEPREWLNAYRHFSTGNIWPRGFPLDEIAEIGRKISSNAENPVPVCAPIQQGLANGSPDVDAVWRLVLDQVVEFDQVASLWLPPGTWCPFNSQSTWWWPEAYPLMYLPSYCSFRMTDIWRSFIAQRCLWEMGYGIVFHGAEVQQVRNEHDLMRDFADEVSGYLRNKELASVLTELQLEGGGEEAGRNLLACYQALVSSGFFPNEELELVRAWLSDLHAMGVVEAIED